MVIVVNVVIVAGFDYSLIEPNDKIAVAVSGGKDSSTLAFLLQLLHKRRMLPFDWSFVTMHLDQVQPGHDPSSLQEWCESLGIEFHLLREDTYSIVKEKTKEGSSYCSLCSRLRRGILYTATEDLGCNRLALGHHRDDALETLLMNMCHQGQTKATFRSNGRHKPLFASMADISQFPHHRGAISV